MSFLFGSYSLVKISPFYNKAYGFGEFGTYDVTKDIIIMEADKQPNDSHT